MNEGLEKLYSIGKKESRIIVGLMSGTSLDGLDVAVCKIKGHGINTKMLLLQFETINYDDDFKEEVKSIFSKQQVSLEKLCLLNEWIGIKHAAIVKSCLQNWNILIEHVDLIASHGQTIYHAPKHLHQNKKFGNGTLQIGDGDHIAVNTGIITISDFRQKQIAAGGEGAPLAAYGDFILFADKENDVILLNIGGISNFTFLPAGFSFKNSTCSDIGPGNNLMDAWMEKNFPGKYFDKEASVASRGNVHEGLLNVLQENEFFALAFPKTTGPELFNLSFLQNAMNKTNTTTLAIADVMATLNQFTATVISNAIRSVTTNPDCKVFVSGGGMHNPLLIANIKKNVPGISIKSTIEKNINPDAKEAILFAILANECVAGNKQSFGNADPFFPVVSMGKISLPG